MTLYLLCPESTKNSVGLRTTDLAEIVLGWVALAAFWAILADWKFTYLELYFEHVTPVLEDFFPISSKPNHFKGQNCYKTYFWNSHLVLYTSEFLNICFLYDKKSVRISRRSHKNWIIFSTIWIETRLKNTTI